MVRQWSGHSINSQLGALPACHKYIEEVGEMAAHPLPSFPVHGCFTSQQEMAASSSCPSALAISTISRVAGLPLLLALRRTPAPAGTRAPALGATCSWSPLRPDLAVAPRPGARARAPLLRPRAWLTTPQIASTAFTVGTVAVLPFYTLMIAAPNADITKRTVESTAPYVALGLLYAYLLYLSWTPDTIRAMFASKYWLPELPGIVRMFASEMTVASAWIHLLAVDLFAARQVYHDGIKNNIETRHSISLCLLFCPVGIAAHALTKVLAGSVGRSH